MFSVSGFKEPVIQTWEIVPFVYCLVFVLFHSTPLLLRSQGAKQLERTHNAFAPQWSEMATGLRSFIMRRFLAQ